MLDQGWYEFRRKLAYKLRWLGGTLFLVPARDTSRRCSACGHTAAENRPSQTMFRCVQCGHSENADLNAAKNVLGAGQALSAC
ncbi:MAG: transposase [Candidatus Schekmanbacteria bacterium]|nr:transposase [Candidatus Schekmanbacteria bacterium]